MGRGFATPLSYLKDEGFLIRPCLVTYNNEEQPLSHRFRSSPCQYPEKNVRNQNCKKNHHICDGPDYDIVGLIPDSKRLPVNAGVGSQSDIRL